MEYFSSPILFLKSLLIVVQSANTFQPPLKDLTLFATVRVVTLFAAIRNKHQPLAAALSAKPEPEAPSAEVSGKKKKNQRKKNKCLNCKKPGFLIKTFC